MITSPARFAGRISTLIYNIFTNVHIQATSAIILSADISDHLPVLIHLDLAPLTKTEPTTYFSRNLNGNSMERFKILLTEIDWSPVIDLCKSNDPTVAYHLSVYSRSPTIKRSPYFNAPGISAILLNNHG